MEDKEFQETQYKLASIAIILKSIETIPDKEKRQELIDQSMVLTEKEFGAACLKELTINQRKQLEQIRASILFIYNYQTTT